MKTYSSKSNARRAAKTQGLDLNTTIFTELEKGKWIIEVKLPEKTRKQDPTYPVDTTPVKKEDPIYYVEGAPVVAHTGKSTIERPCSVVWELAESMPGARRKDVIAKAVEMGVAYYTARTQYQQWLTVKRESENTKNKK